MFIWRFPGFGILGMAHLHATRRCRSRWRPEGGSTNGDQMPTWLLGVLAVSPVHMVCIWWTVALTPCVRCSGVNRLIHDEAPMSLIQQYEVPGQLFQVFRMSMGSDSSWSAGVVAETNQTN